MFSEVIEEVLVLYLKWTIARFLFLILFFRGLRSSIRLLTLKFMKELLFSLEIIIFFILFFPTAVMGFYVTYTRNLLELPRNSLFNRRNIWILSDCNGTQTHNHLARKWTQLFSQTGQFGWKSACLPTMWLWVQVLLQSPRLCFYCFRNKKQTSHANYFNLSFESTILEEIMMAMGGSVKRSTYFHGSYSEILHKFPRKTPVNPLLKDDLVNAVFV